MQLSVIIPCYNEEKNLPILFNKLRPLLNYEDCEICLVDNGSCDNTYELLKSFEAKEERVLVVKVNKNKGYGYGILKGLSKAKGNILSWTHADIQTDPIDILTGLKLFEKYGENIFVKGMRYGRPLSDRFFTIGMSLFVSIILKKFFWDVNAQPTMFSSNFFQRLLNPPNDFSLDLFTYFEASKNNLKIYRFPVLFKKRLYGKSSWNISFSSKLKFIKRTIKFTFNLKENIDNGNYST
mgnify:CR=1 FL=1|tara:strand:+ start:46477 stop:47190 length:714 start_codon:yes stop_codon:yes gene_type:complete